MKHSTYTLPRLVATCLLAGAASFVNAQSGSHHDRSSMKMSDTSFIRKNIQDNMNEISMAQLGVDRGSDDKVKSLAQQLVTDHTQILNDLKDIAGSKNMSDLESADMSMGGGNGNSSVSMGSGNGATPGSGSSDVGTTTSQNSGSIGSGGTLGGSTNTAGDKTSDSSSSSSSSASSDTGMQGMSRQGGMGHDGMKARMEQKKQELMNESGEQFDALWTSDMLQMHNKKLSELNGASKWVTDAKLKAAITTAMAKVRSHRDALATMDKSKGGSGKGMKGNRKMKGTGRNDDSHGAGTTGDTQTSGNSTGASTSGTTGSNSNSNGTSGSSGTGSATGAGSGSRTGSGTSR